MNRIEKLFKQKNAGVLSVFFTAGFPTLEATIPTAIALEHSGVDMIEIGIPFSDPVADGPTIQQSNKVALDNGMNLSLLLDQVKALRHQISIPIILMGYLNPVMQYGIPKFIEDASRAGVDGLILPDLPVDEFADELQPMFRAANLSTSFLISPTTSEERIRKIDAVTTGFIYAVSSSSTTGTRTSFDPDQMKYLSKLQSLQLRNPHLVGFGVSDSHTFSQASRYSSGAIVGSAFIKMLGSSANPDKDIKDFINRIRNNA